LAFCHGTTHPDDFIPAGQGRHFTLCIEHPWARFIFSLSDICGSGFAGLIYESIWTRYFKLFLGYAAYAQSLALAIFMGGMAI